MAAGRVFAVEMAFYTVAETVSGLGGGAMFDGLHLSTQGVSGVMAVVAAVVTVRNTDPDQRPHSSSPLPAQQGASNSASHLRACQHLGCKLSLIGTWRLRFPASATAESHKAL